MHNHRLVPEGVEPSIDLDGDEVFFMGKRKAIPMPSEWTAEQLVALASIGKDNPAEWDEVDRAFHRWRATRLQERQTTGIKYPVHLMWFLRELIYSSPLKGLTVEEIRKLNEVKK